MITFNLSKEEYLTYLECPLKFYLKKESIELIQKEKEKEDTILWKEWFKTFHSIYENCIKNNDQPFERGTENTVARLFYKFELERYLNYPYFWEPLVQDFFIQNDYYRGKIDRVDQLNEKGQCRLIQYIVERKETIDQEMLFLAVLIEHEKKNLEWFPKDGRITELGVYNYLTGEFSIRKITSQDILNYESVLYSTLKDILRPTLKKNVNCAGKGSNCLYREICKRMPL